MTILSLDERLRQALFLAEPCELCADVGADHGRLSAALLQSGRARRVLVSDVSAPSLLKAKTLLGGLGLSDRAAFVVADGLHALEALEGAAPQHVFILGMGGQTLSRILQEGRSLLRGATLVLGAQTDLPLLRETLCQIGYRIRREIVVEENRRYYILTRCTPALEGEPVYDERELLLGPMLLQERPPLWRPVLQRREKLLTDALAAMKDAEGVPAQKEAYQRELDYVRQALDAFRRES